jgi:hypothetical protein
MLLLLYSNSFCLQRLWSDSCNVLLPLDFPRGNCACLSNLDKDSFEPLAQSRSTWSAQASHGAGLRYTDLEQTTLPIHLTKLRWLSRFFLFPPRSCFGSRMSIPMILMLLSCLCVISTDVLYSLLFVYSL